MQLLPSVNLCLQVLPAKPRLKLLVKCFVYGQHAFIHYNLLLSAKITHTGRAYTK